MLSINKKCHQNRYLGVLEIIGCRLIPFSARMVVCLCVCLSIDIQIMRLANLLWIKGEVGAPLNRFKPSSKIFNWPFQGGTSFVDLLCFCSVLCLLCLCARLFICAVWSPAGKGLTSWLSFVVSYCEFVTFPLVSWVGCGTWLYRLLIFAPLLTLYRALGIQDICYFTSRDIGYSPFYSQGYGILCSIFWSLLEIMNI